MGRRQRLRHTSKQVSSDAPKQLSCEVCPKKFSHKGNLLKHIKRHESGLEPKRKKSQQSMCDVCSKTFQTRKGLSAHKMRFHNGNKPFYCDECSYAGPMKSDLKMHMR